MIKSKAAKLPTFWHERRVKARGYEVIIGVDEVGRGAFAGPVVAGAVAFDSESFKKGDSLKGVSLINLGIDDSKRLKRRQREKLAKIIKENALWGIGEVGVAKINKIGIGRASAMAMRQAIAKVKGQKAKSKSFVLIDAFHIKYIGGVGLKNQKGIIKGDQKVLSIAAASIIAKVYRDKLMHKFYKKYKNYKWSRNKGYGTADHIEAIKKHGLTRLHRLAFVKNIV